MLNSMLLLLVFFPSSSISILSTTRPEALKSELPSTHSNVVARLLLLRLMVTDYICLLSYYINPYYNLALSISLLLGIFHTLKNCSKVSLWVSVPIFK